MLQQNVLQHPALNNNRTRILFLGPMALTPERQHLLGMTGVVNSSKLSFTRYLEEIQSSRYILSPNGDRPECYRHYEAIGMGTIPVTQLDSVRYRHLQGAVIYANAEWKNMTALEEQLLEGRLRPSTTHDDDDHRAMVLEEYWMEYVERVVGRPLRWWDRKRGRPSLIEDLELTTTTTG
jgi:PAS domain-containing protein